MATNHQCNRCGQPLGTEPYASLNYHVERLNQSGTAITVEQAEPVLVLCRDCGPNRGAVMAQIK